MGVSLVEWSTERLFRRNPVSYSFPPELSRLVREGLATGTYGSEDELLLEAVRVLNERNEAIAGIREGLADLDVGRVRSLGSGDAELRMKYGIRRDATPEDLS
jgi:Arc/MetJ-type ribon-helix-helix transcriptional regulator